MKSTTTTGRLPILLTLVAISIVGALAQLYSGLSAESALAAPACDWEVYPGAGSPLQTAVSAAAAGQTICVHGGVYHEAVRVPSAKTGLTLIAAPGETPIIDGQKILPGGMPEHRFQALVELNSPGLVFDGFEVRFSSARGIDVTADDIVVRNADVHDNWSTGINVRGGGPVHGVLIEDNRVYHNMRRAQNAPVIYRGQRSGAGSGPAEWAFDPALYWDSPFWTGVEADLPEQWLNGISMTFNNDGLTSRIYAGSPRAGRVGYIGAEHSITGQQFSYSGADILFHDPSIDKWTLYLNGDTPAVDIPASGVIDAFQIESTAPETWACGSCAPVLMSFTQTVSIPLDEGGVVTHTSIGPSDLVRFWPSAVGPYDNITGGLFTLYLRAADLAGLPPTANIDALDRAPDGRLLMSMTTDLTIGSLPVDKEDLVAYDEATQTWELFFDGDQIPFNPFGSEDLTAAWLDHAGNIYISGNPVGGSALTLIDTRDSTARRNTVYNNYGEGLVADRFSVGATLEDNVVYDNQHANLYLNSTTNTLVQRNLVYCTDDQRFWRKGSTPTYRPGPGIQIRDETFETVVPPVSSGQVIINNLVIGCSSNFGVSTQTPGGGLNNALVANNTFANARGQTAEAVNNIELSSGASYAGSRFINNLILQTAVGAILRVQGSNPNFSTFTVAHNLYSVAPPVSWFAGEAGRVVGEPVLDNPAPPLPAMSTAPDRNDYRVTISSPALDAGQPLVELADDLFAQSRAQNGPPDIGAHEFLHRGRIIVIQTTVPAGSSQPFTFNAGYVPAAFTLSHGQEHQSGVLQAGIYSVASDPVEDWTTTASCSDGSPATAIVLGAAETVTCTFTSVRESRLIVTNTIAPAGDAQTFDFTLDPGQSFQLGNETRTFVVEPGPYSLAAVLPVGWEQDAACDNGDAPDELTIAAGEWVTCDFTHRQLGRIIVSKQTDPPGTPSTFSFTATYGSFSLSHGQSHDSGLLSPGVAYSVAEAPLPGWEISSASCAGDDDGTSPAGIQLDPGETVTCTFTNRRTTAGPLAKFYVTTPNAGTVRGLAYSPGDILVYDNANDAWSLYFDASDVGITKALNDFVLMEDGSILMVFKARVKPLDGSGAILTVEPHDVARFVPQQLGSATAGYFAAYFDGSDVALSTSGEKIDALTWKPGGPLGTLLISTTGAAAVKTTSGTLKGADEDLLAFQIAATGTTTTGTWMPAFDGSTLKGMAVENLTAVWRDDASGYLYLTILNNFNILGVAGTNRTVISVSPTGAVAKYWDAAAAGFPGAVDGLYIDLLY